MPQSEVLKSALWYLCFCFSLNCTDVVAKTLAESAIPISMALFLRGIIGFISFSPSTVHFQKTFDITTSALNALRALSTLVAISVWMIPLQTATLTSATAVTLLSPIFATVLAYLVLGDKLTKANLLAFIISLLGTIIIIEPHGKDFNPNLLYSALSAFAWSINLIATKLISKRHPASEIMCQYNLFLATLCLLQTKGWYLPSLSEAGFLVLFSVLGNFRQFALLRATRKTPVSVLMPLEYARLVFAALIAITIYGELPRIEAFIGGALILVGSMLTSYAITPRKQKIFEEASLRGID